MSEHEAGRILTQRAVKAEERAQDMERRSWLRRISLFALILLLLYFLVVNYNEARTIQHQNATIAALVEQGRADQQQYNEERKDAADQASVERAEATKKIDALTRQVALLSKQVTDLGGTPVGSGAAAPSSSKATGSGSTSGTTSKPASGSTTKPSSGSTSSASRSSTTKPRTSTSPGGGGGSEGVPATPAPTPTPVPSPEPGHGGIVGVCVLNICL